MSPVVQWASLPFNVTEWQIRIEVGEFSRWAHISWAANFPLNFRKLIVAENSILPCGHEGTLPAGQLSAGQIEVLQTADTPDRTEISDYYNDTVLDYNAWSKEGYLHFGYWRPWLNPLVRRPMLEEMNRFILKHLELETWETGTVADLGCGVGAVSRFGSRQFPNLDFHAMSISPGQIAEARQRHTNERVTYYCGDYHSLPFADSSIDGLFYLESLCHSTEPERALAEAARVLKPGGRIVMTDGYLCKPLDKTSALFRYIVQGVAHNWAVPMFHELEKARHWQAEGKIRLIKDIECGWRLGPSALHAAHLSLIQFFKLLLSRRAKTWQWKHLTASAFTIALGLYRRHFRYHLLVFERV